MYLIIYLFVDNCFAGIVLVIALDGSVSIFIEIHMPEIDLVGESARSAAEATGNFVLVLITTNPADPCASGRRRIEARISHRS